MPLTSFAILAALITQPAPAKLNVVQPLPDKPPAWLDGYRLRWPLRVIGDPAKQTAKSVVTSIATGGWLKPDAADLAVQAATGEQLPVAVLSHDPNGETIIQFPRKANDAWYWVYGVHASPKPAVKPTVIQEALTVEVRDWAGDDLKDWASVRNGLQKSENVIGNALVPDVCQNTNLAATGRRKVTHPVVNGPRECLPPVFTVSVVVADRVQAQLPTGRMV